MRQTDERRAPLERCRPLDEWFLQDFQPNGYAAGRPPWWHHDPSAEEIDREVAEHATCAACGTVGQDWWPVRNVAERSYRAFTRCPACGHCEEF